MTIGSFEPIENFNIVYKSNLRVVFDTVMILLNVYSCISSLYIATFGHYNQSVDFDKYIEYLFILELTI